MSLLASIRQLRRSTLPVPSHHCFNYPRWKSTAASLKPHQLLVPNIKVFESSLKNSSRIAVSQPSHANTLAVHQHSYGDLLNDSLVVKSALLSGDTSSDMKERRVAFLMPRGYSFVKSLCGTWAAGGIAVPLCTSHPAAELLYTVQDSGADTVMFHPEFNAPISALRSLLPSSSSIRFISTNDLDTPFAAKSQNLQVSLNDFDKRRGALIVYTSGTTGKPKGVLSTHASLEAQISSLVDAWGWSSSDKILHVLPLHHVHGLVNVLLCSLASGATCEFTLGDKFDPQSIFDRWTRPQRDLSLFMAVPTIYAKLAQHFSKLDTQNQQTVREACSQFRVMVSGSSALPQSVFENWERISGHSLLERYGMTEIGMALSNPLHGKRVPGEVGFPLPNVHVKILNQETGKDVTDIADEPGQLLVSGPAVFEKYWRKPEATKDAFMIHGTQKWFLTGDIACRTVAGSFKILGRASVDIIKVGGYKVSALDIEREILDHPIVAEVAVCGVHDESWGEKIAAIVVLKDTANGKQACLDLDSLRSWLASRLAPYKLPSLLLTLNEIPKNAMGKVNKKQLAKLFLAEK